MKIGVWLMDELVWELEVKDEKEKQEILSRLEIMESENGRYWEKVKSKK